MGKQLEKNSRYEQYDVDGDGVVTDEEISRNAAILEVELKEAKAETQQRMAWSAMISMLVFTTFLFLPVFDTERIDALSDVLGLFYIAQAGVVGAYMGVTAWMSKK